MSKTGLNSESEHVLDDDVIGAIGESLVAAPAADERKERLRGRVLEQIANAPERRSLFDTIREGDGEWIEILPLISKKVLQLDRERGVESSDADGAGRENSRAPARIRRALLRD